MTQNLPLTSKPKLKTNRTFVLKSTGGFAQRDVSPSSFVDNEQRLTIGKSNYGGKREGDYDRLTINERPFVTIQCRWPGEQFDVVVTIDVRFTDYG